jgi:DNA polymerase III epsilon subunit-like protein
MHAFENRPISTCATCGIVRMRKSAGPLYAVSADSEVWAKEEPACLTEEQLQALIEVDWRKSTIVMFDVETTGLDWADDLVTEVAAVSGRLVPVGEGFFNLDVRREYSALIKLEVDARARVETTQGITGITFDMLQEDGRPIGEVLSAIESLIHDEEREAIPSDAVAGDPNVEDLVLASAYNSRFDQPFLNAMFLREGRRTPHILSPKKSLLDPYLWVQSFDRYVRGTGRHKLTTTAVRHELITEADTEHAHRADFDARLALQLLAKNADRVPADLLDLLDWQRVAQAEWAQNFFGEYLPKKRRRERLDKLRGLP